MLRENSLSLEEQEVDVHFPPPNGEHEDEYSTLKGEKKWSKRGIAKQCGPFFLYLCLGAILGGVIVSMTHGGESNGVDPENEDIFDYYGANLPYDPQCSKFLAKANEKRVVKESLCLDHEQTNNFAKKIMDDSLNFLVIGDWGRDGMCCQRDVAFEMDRSAKNTDAQFIINTGDNFYPAGIASATSEQVETSWKKVYLTFKNLKKLVWYSVLGNHDYYGNSQADLDLAKNNDQWFMPERYYSKTMENNGVSIHVVFLDTTPMHPQYVDTPNVVDFWNSHNTNSSHYLQKQVEFLTNEFQNSTADWRFVVGHHPVYTSGDHYIDDHKTMRQEIHPTFEKLNITAYFNGHDHSLQYHKMGSVNYFLSGAGAQTRPNMYIEDEGFRLYTGQVGGFASVSVSKNSYMVQFIDYQGTLVSETTINK